MPLLRQFDIPPKPVNTSYRRTNLRLSCMAWDCFGNYCPTDPLRFVTQKLSNRKMEGPEKAKLVPSTSHSGQILLHVFRRVTGLRWCRSCQFLVLCSSSSSSSSLSRRSHQNRQGPGSPSLDEGSTDLVSHQTSDTRSLNLRILLRAGPMLLDPSLCTFSTG
jgi:hypothetical protein